MPKKVTLSNVASLQNNTLHPNNLKHPTQSTNHNEPFKCNCTSFSSFFKRRINIILLFILLFKLGTFIILLCIFFNVVIVICDVLCIIVFLISFTIIVRFNQARLTLIFIWLIYLIFYIGHFVIYFAVIQSEEGDYNSKELYITFLFLNLFLQNSIFFTKEARISFEGDRGSYKAKGVNIALWLVLNGIVLVVVNATHKHFINDTILFGYVMLFEYLRYCLLGNGDDGDDDGDGGDRKTGQGVKSKLSKRKSIIKTLEGFANNTNDYETNKQLYHLYETKPSFYGSCIVNSSFLIRYQNSFFANQMQHLCTGTVKTNKTIHNDNEQDHMSNIHINIHQGKMNNPNANNSISNALGNMSSTGLCCLTMNNSLHKLNNALPSSALYLNADCIFHKTEENDNTNNNTNNNDQMHHTLLDKFNRIYGLNSPIHYDAVSSFGSSSASPSISHDDEQQSHSNLNNPHNNSTLTNLLDDLTYKFLGRFKFYNYEKESKYYQIHCRKMHNSTLTQNKQDNEAMYEICFVELTDNLKRNKNKMERKYKNLLLRKINHEFKGPIVFIQNLLNDVYEIDSVIYIKSICNMIRYVTEAILILVSDLTEYIHLNTLKVEEKDLKSCSGSLDLSSLCNDIKNISFVYTKVFNRDVVIDLIIDDKLSNGRITINEAKLKQILAGLITNAIKHSSHMTIHFKTKAVQLTKSRTNTKVMRKKISKRQSLNPNVFKVFYRDHCSFIREIDGSNQGKNTDDRDRDKDKEGDDKQQHRYDNKTIDPYCITKPITNSITEEGMIIVIEDDGPGIDQYIINIINNSNGNINQHQCEDVLLSSVMTCGSYQNQKGLGTGLSICLKLCKDLDVSIHCEKVNKGLNDDDSPTGTRFTLDLEYYAIERDDIRNNGSRSDYSPSARIRRNDGIRHASGMTDQSILTKTVVIEDYGIGSKEKEMVQYDHNNQLCYESPINMPRKQRSSLFTKNFPEYLIPCQVDSKEGINSSDNSHDDDDSSHFEGEINILLPNKFKCELVEVLEEKFSLISSQSQALHNPYAYPGGAGLPALTGLTLNEMDNEISIPFPSCFDNDNNSNMNHTHQPRSPKKKKTVTITKNTSLFNFMGPTGCGGSSTKNAIAPCNNHNSHSQYKTSSNILLPFVNSTPSFKNQDQSNTNPEHSHRSSERYNTNLQILKNLRDITIKDCLKREDTASLCSNAFDSPSNIGCGAANVGKDIIAIVDDIDHNRKAIYNMIKVYMMKKEKIDAYDIRTLADGLELLNLFYQEHLVNKTQIKVILSDECMEYLHGSETYKIMQTICTNRKIKEVPYVICSAFNDNGHREKLISVGIKDIYEKPLKTSDIDMICGKYKL